jgi:hypothetical protein
MFIPAGILIGLGVGLLLGHPASGVLVGLGLGFIGTALARVKSPAAETGAENQNDYYRRSSPVLFTLLGIAMICMGFGIVWVPAGFGPVMAAAILILLGVGILYRGFAAAQG